MPSFLNYALSPIAENTGLSEFVPSGAASSSSFSNGLANPTTPPNPQNFNTISEQSLTPGAVPKPPPVDFKHEAEFGFGKNNINEYLKSLKKDNADQNKEFQDLVNNVVGQSFPTQGGINPRMPAIMDHHYDNLNKAALNYIKSPYDGGARTAFYKRLLELLETIKSGAATSDATSDVTSAATSDVTSAATSAAISDATSDATSDAKRWWQQLWGGRKTARNHKRSRSRGRSRKQYKKLKRSSRSRRR